MPLIAHNPDKIDPPKRPSGLIPWKPGQSGNPGGKTKLEMECRRFAAERSLYALEKVAQILDCGDPRAVLVAANTILDRAYGKPKEMTAETQRALLDVAKLGPDTLTTLAAILRQASVNPVIDASSEADAQSDNADTSTP